MNHTARASGVMLGTFIIQNMRKIQFQSIVALHFHAQRFHGVPDVLNCRIGLLTMPTNVVGDAYANQIEQALDENARYCWAVACP